MIPTVDAMPYVGRFAPSPSGPLHAGSLVAALASFLDARAHHGRWLLRIEDVDIPRTVRGADRIILQQLQTLGLQADTPPVWQTQRQGLYAQALARLQAQGLAYPCTCHRRELPAGPYPGICRPHQTRPSDQPAIPIPPTQDAHVPSAQADLGVRNATADAHAGPQRNRRPSWRFWVPPSIETFTDRALGLQSQDVAHDVGDFILRRTDGFWAYQLAVVVDDADQGITDVVRGADLLDSTARQRQLARALGLPLPRTLHVPLRVDRTGHKLSKQNHAPALDLCDPLQALKQAWGALGFADFSASTPEAFWPEATRRWAARFPIASP